ncbi:MAG TPA: transaldolase [Candidatus Limnocylindrales bacterium]|nr:transaldolase [Candidatus Limnocylindrales bacterium]
MTATHDLHELGQSLWIDNITRPMLDSGTLARYIEELDVTGLTSNPTIYDKAIGGSDAYDDDVRRSAEAGDPPEETFFEVALSDLTRAADLFRPVHDATDGVDGFVSLEVSPLIAYDSAATTADAARLHGKAGRPNLFIKIPGTQEGLAAIEESILAGIPINVTLLFSPKQYLAAAEAYTRGIERRIEAGLDPRVTSVASLFISRWDSAVTDKVPAELNLKLGLAIGGAAYGDYREFFATPRWEALKAKGARVQRLLFASTGTKDPTASKTLYIEGLAAPDTINTMPEETLLALAEADARIQALPTDGEAARAQLARFEEAGISVDALGLELQQKGADAFVKSWESLLARVQEKAQAVTSGR